MIIKIIIFVILLLVIWFCFNFNSKSNINSNILPFGYQLTPLINTSSKKDFYKLLDLYGNEKDKNITNKILSIKHKYAPTWGIKIDKFDKIEFEMYFYVYNPKTRNFEDEAITLDKLEDKFTINTACNPKFTMYSIDYNQDEFVPNFYYFTYSDDEKDVGFSEKNKELNNHYYRYYPHTIDKKFTKYIDEQLINYDIKNIKSVFIADKLIRNYYGIYYDGISYSQLKYFIKKYDFDENIIKNLNNQSHYSVSVDYNKIDDAIMRIGIYGLLY